MAQWLLVLLCAVSCTSLAVLQQSHDITLTETSPETSLNYYLCGEGRSSLQSNTRLLLLPNVSHSLTGTNFCLVSNISSLFLCSSSAHSPANITCSSSRSGLPTVGFGFYNVSGLTIEHVNIHHCGGVMPSPTDDQYNLLYPKDDAFYFPEGQPIMLLVSYSSNITLDLSLIHI